MKTFSIFILTVFLILSIQTEVSISQTCPECICGTTGPGFEEPDSLIGGRYKPARTDIWRATQDRDEFPVLIVFVQFQNEPYSYSSDPGAWNSGMPPNYADNIISEERLSSSSWWDSYNGYAISDYWHEFSRGKLHITGQAISIILPHEINWYDTTGRGIAKLNKDIYDILTDSLQSNWRKYDLWSITRKGQFDWGKDKLADMVYITFRQWRNFLFSGATAWGFATLGNCEGASNYRYTVFENSTDTVRILSSDLSDSLGSGLRIHADSGIYSKQRFIDLATHEHGHYLFGWGHNVYSKMSYGGGYSGGWEFSLSPWELIKLGLINPSFPDYSNSTNNLYDYSSRGQYGVDTNEIIQVPISSDGEEFFLIANRRKQSEWDRRIGGDSLANDRLQFLKPINNEYGKGIYIYHVKGAYETNEPNIYGNGNDNDIDLECADGLWKYVYAGFQRKRINNLQLADVYKKQYPSFNNDSPESNPGYTSGKDDMSNSVIFTPGSPDNFSTSPVSRGTHSIYTNDDDYWYSLASLGDRWDAWNVGYNEIFSPYSSPNTKNMLNNQTGIFIYYKSLNSSTNEAQLEIFRTGYGGKTEEQILEITPPSRPMGLRVVSCDSTPVINGYQRIRLRWFHNMEPDMEENGIKKYKVYWDRTPSLGIVQPDAMQNSQYYYSHVTVVTVPSDSIPEYTDSFKVSSCYPHQGGKSSQIPRPIQGAGN